jgi:hypothetical protein
MITKDAALIERNAKWAILATVARHHRHSLPNAADSSSRFLLAEVVVGRFWIVEIGHMDGNSLFSQRQYGRAMLSD